MNQLKFFISTKTIFLKIQYFPSLFFEFEFENFNISEFYFIFPNLSFFVLANLGTRI